MEEFVATLQARLHEAGERLREALAQDDDYLVCIRSGELDSLRRLALDHGVTAA